MATIIDGRPYVRPCRHIPPEGTDHNEWASTPVPRGADVRAHMPVATDLAVRLS